MWIATFTGSVTQNGVLRSKNKFLNGLKLIPSVIRVYRDLLRNEELAKTSRNNVSYQYELSLHLTKYEFSNID